MRLPEYISKEIFSEKNIRVPQSLLLNSVKAFEERERQIATMLPIVVKAQNLIGSRGKKGGIRVCETLEECRQAVSSLFEEGFGDNVVEEILIEKKVTFESGEYYVSFSLDRFKKCFSLIVSNKGGIDIEEASEDSFSVTPINPLLGFQEFHALSAANVLSLNDTESRKSFVELVKTMYQIVIELGAILVEINPLVIDKETKEIVALDAKIILDANSVIKNSRLKEIVKKQKEKLAVESKISMLGYNCVELDGDIAVISNGAGEGMAIIDQVVSLGGHVGWWVDLAGGALAAGRESLKDLFREILKKRPSALLFSAFFQIGDSKIFAEVLKEIDDETSKDQGRAKIIARLCGRNAEEAAEILKDSGIHVTSSAEEACSLVVQVVDSPKN